jgi:hypothetical protein
MNKMENKELILTNLWGSLLKVLQMNLTEDTYRIIQVSGNTLMPEVGQPRRISEYFRKFALEGNVYEDDLEEYLLNTEIGFLKEEFKRNKNGIHFCYRRKCKEEFRWGIMDMVPAIEYTEEHQVITLYIRDIHEGYMQLLANRQQLEFYADCDRLTGVYNVDCFSKKK